MNTKTDPNAAYNAKVLEVAEELAKIEHQERCTTFCDESTWDALDHYGQEVAISSQMRAARAMVAEMKKMHYQGYITGLAAMEQFPEDCETNIDRRTQYFHWQQSGAALFQTLKQITMSEQKMSYVQRVAELRDRMRKKNSLRIYDAAAKEAVAAQAEAIREALKLFRAPVWTEQYLLEHGYIEPKTE